VWVLYDDLGESEDPKWDGFFGRLSLPWIKRHVAHLWQPRSCELMAKGLQGEQIHRVVLDRLEGTP
jgi:hypothetical protein